MHFILAQYISTCLNTRSWPLTRLVNMSNTIQGSMFEPLLRYVLLYLKEMMLFPITTLPFLQTGSASVSPVAIKKWYWFCVGNLHNSKCSAWNSQMHFMLQKCVGQNKCSVTAGVGRGEVFVILSAILKSYSIISLLINGYIASTLMI